MTRIPRSARTCAEKVFYLYFAFGGKYHGCYTSIKASTMDKARLKALEEYGLAEIGRIEPNRERAEAYIKTLALKSI